MLQRELEDVVEVGVENPVLLERWGEDFFKKGMYVSVYPTGLCQSPQLHSWEVPMGLFPTLLRVYWTTQALEEALQARF